MKRKAGLWIDHRKAVIVFLSGREEEIKVIKSNVEKQIEVLNERRTLDV